MADFISHYMNSSSNLYEDTQNSVLPLNRDEGHGDFVLSCIDTQSENSQTFEFMKFNNSNKKESNLEVIREEESSIFNHMQQDYQDYEENPGKKLNKDHLNSNKVQKSNPQDKSRDLLATINKNKGSSSHSNNLTEKIKKISQEIDDIYEETQKSESVKTKDLGVKEMSSVYTMNKCNSFQPANTIANLNFQANNQNNSINISNNHGQNFLINNPQSGVYSNSNQTNPNPNSNLNVQMGKSYQTNIYPDNNYGQGQHQIGLNNTSSFSNNNPYQNPKINLLNSTNPANNNLMPPNFSNNISNLNINKTKGKVNVNNPPSTNNNSTPIGFYNPNDSTVLSSNNITVQNKSNIYLPQKNNFKNNQPSSNDLSNSFRIETEENIKKAVAIFDNIKQNFCNFIDNYKNKFIYDAEIIKQVLVSETDYIIQEEEKNRLIDSRMETLFRDMMNILNEFQPRY